MESSYVLDSRLRGNDTLGLARLGNGRLLHSAKMVRERSLRSAGEAMSALGDMLAEEGLAGQDLCWPRRRSILLAVGFRRRTTAGQPIRWSTNIHYAGERLPPRF